MTLCFHLFMALIVSIETCAATCSVALSKDGTLLALAENTEGYAHASQLTLLIQQLFEKVDYQLKDTDAIAVSSGPGSFTGLRIGASVAKGLCYSLNIPLIFIDTLKALAAKAVQISKNKNAFYIPMIDARRMEVYTTVFDHQLNCLLPFEAKIIDANSFASFLEQSPVYFFGNGAKKCENTLKSANANFNNYVPLSSSNLVALAHQQYAAQQFANLAYTKLHYGK